MSISPLNLDTPLFANLFFGSSTLSTSTRASTCICLSTALVQMCNRPKLSTALIRCPSSPCHTALIRCPHLLVVLPLSAAPVSLSCCPNVTSRIVLFTADRLRVQPPPTPAPTSPRTALPLPHRALRPPSPPAPPTQRVAGPSPFTRRTTRRTGQSCARCSAPLPVGPAPLAQTASGRRRAWSR